MASGAEGVSVWWCTRVTMQLRVCTCVAHDQATFIHQFHSKDDHLIPVAEARFVAQQLAGKNHTYEELEGSPEPFPAYAACGMRLRLYASLARALDLTWGKGPLPGSRFIRGGIWCRVAACALRLCRPCLTTTHVHCIGLRLVHAMRIA